jgi:GAF domain-containing protein
MDNTERARNRLEEHDVLTRLGEIYAPVAGLQPVEAAALLVARTLDDLGADTGFLATLAPDGQTLEVIRVTPASENLVRLAFPLSSPYPIAEAMRGRQSMFIASNEQLRCDHPGLVRVQSEDHACATLPLFDDQGELLGAINIGFDDPHEFSEDERSGIEMLADRCATVMASPAANG